MGKEINTENYEYCPFVTKDGKYLFYTSNQDIYWVSIEIINKIKKTAGNNGYK
jgi:topoisomerase IA-like protein